MDSLTTAVAGVQARAFEAISQRCPPHEPQEQNDICYTNDSPRIDLRSLSPIAIDLLSHASGPRELEERATRERTVNAP